MNLVNGKKLEMDGFEWAQGSVIGREHQRLRRNSQDAVLVNASTDYVIGIVADGCSSQKHSEVGAWLGVELLAGAIATHLPNALSDKYLLDVGNQVIEALPKVSSPQDYYLFTLLGFVITAQEVVIFGCGDGLYTLNGELRQFAFANNAPPYLIYPEAHLQVFERIATEQLQSLLVATDGLEDWLGTKKIEDFWEQDRYFRNPDQVRRSLAITQKKEALLRDDTTLITVRRGEVKI